MLRLIPYKDGTIAEEVAQLPAIFKAIPFSPPVQRGENSALKEGLEFQDDVEFSLAKDTVGLAKVTEKPVSSAKPRCGGGILIGYRQEVNRDNLIEIGVTGKDIFKGFLPGDIGP
jgi:hypothetical protein